MMNGTPKKHSFSSSEEKRGKQMKGGSTAMEGKEGVGVWTCMVNILSYFCQEQCFVTRCNVTHKAVSGDASMATS